MTHGNGQPKRIYSVEMSSATKARMLELYKEAIQKGVGHRFLNAIRQVTND